MKTKLILLLTPVLMLLASCKGNSVFGGGLWIVPVGLAIAALFSWGRYLLGLFDLKVKGSEPPKVYAIILTLALIASIIWILLDK